MKAELIISDRITTEFNAGVRDLCKYVDEEFVPDNPIVSEVILNVLKIACLLVYIVCLLIALIREQRLLNYNPQLLLPEGKHYLK